MLNLEETLEISLTLRSNINVYLAFQFTNARRLERNAAMARVSAKSARRTRRNSAAAADADPGPSVRADYIQMTFVTGPNFACH